MRIFATLVTLVLSIARPMFVNNDFNHHIDQSYQAVAHLFVGALIGAWLANENGFGWCLKLAGVLTAVELVCVAVHLMS